MKQSREIQNQRKSDFKRGIDSEDARRKRDDIQYSIRKNKREEKLMKRRYQHDSHDSHHIVVKNNVTTTNNIEKPRVKTVMRFTLKAGEENELENELYELLYNNNDDTDIIENTQKLNSDLFESIIEGAIFFRSLSSRENPPLDKIIKAKIVPRLVKLSTFINYPDLQYESLWALSNIASGDSVYTNEVATTENINIFIKLLNSKEVKVRDHAILVLGNIAGDSLKFRRIMMAHPYFIEIIIKNIQYAPKAVYAQNAIWLLANLSREQPHFSYEDVPEKIIPIIGILLNYPRDQLDSDLLSEIFWLIYYLTNRKDAEKIIKTMISNNIFKKVIELTYFNKTMKVEAPSIKILGNVAYHGETETQDLIDGKVFIVLPQLLRSKNKTIRKEAFYTLSNIAAGTEYQQELLVKYNNNQLISETVFTVNDDKVWSVKKEAAYVIYNLVTNKKHKYHSLLLKLYIIAPIVNLLDSMSIDTIIVALKILKELLKEDNLKHNVPHIIEDSGGLDKIEMLQTHDNETIYELSSEIIETYFSDDDISFAPPLSLLDKWETEHAKKNPVFDF